LSNFSGTTLTGGSYYVAGTLQFGASGSSMVNNDANLTLAGTGAQLLNLAAATCSAVSTPTPPAQPSPSRPGATLVRPAISPIRNDGLEQASCSRLPAT